MSLFRLVFGALLMGICFLGLNVYASPASPASPAATNLAAEDATSTSKPMELKSGKVDLNSADVAALAKVRGLDKKKAQAIVDYRTKNGSFKSLEDLKNVTNSKGKAMFNNRSIKRLGHHISVE